MRMDNVWATVDTDYTPSRLPLEGDLVLIVDACDAAALAAMFADLHENGLKMRHYVGYFGICSMWRLQTDW